MPTRRTMELVVITAVLLRPTFGLVRLWSSKALGSYPPGSLPYTIANINSVVFG